MRTIGVIQGSEIVEQADGSVTFSAGATLDGDGANGQFGGLPCYAPKSFGGKTLDVIENAGQPGDWFGVVTDNGEVTGNPILQGANDPCPGAFVSATSLHLPDRAGNRLPASSPFKYVDSATVPFIVVPMMIVRGVTDVGKESISDPRRTHCRYGRRVSLVGLSQAIDWRVALATSALECTTVEISLSMGVASTDH
jgi:hypothetical protein